jgi:hypothetical protein
LAETKLETKLIMALPPRPILFLVIPGLPATFAGRTRNLPSDIAKKNWIPGHRR